MSSPSLNIKWKTFIHVVVFMYLRFTFKSMNLAEKKNCISINMDHLLIEIPIVIERLEDLSKNMDDKFGWKEFKFCFKFATSHIVSELVR